MAQIFVEGNIKIGFVYECIFGNFKLQGEDNSTTEKQQADDKAYDYRIPVEMIKKRAVVVLGKYKGQYIVVPISATQDKGKKVGYSPEDKGFHVRLNSEDLPYFGKYKENMLRWAKCNLITTVDGGRFRDIYDPKIKKNAPAHKISEETLKKIQNGILISIGVEIKL